MKFSVFSLVFFIYSISAFGQLPIHADTLYTFIRWNSIHRDKVNWDELDKSFHNNLKKAKNTKDTMQCFVDILEKLNDVHSQIYLNNQYFGHYPNYPDSTIKKLKPLVDKARSQANQIHTSLLKDKFVYVRVPSFNIYDYSKINVYAQALHDSIAQYKTHKPKGFIIDLRLNEGGNLYPMIAGLSLFLGNQIIGYEKDINNKIARTWEIKNGNFVIGNYQATKITINPELRFENMPVVVLLGPVTKSSGSMTAIAFKNRPHTFFIGEPTADGYTTSNGYFSFSSNLILNFATNFVADRKMNVYKTTVNPDSYIYQGDNFENLLEDKKVKYAIKWLKAK